MVVGDAFMRYQELENLYNDNYKLKFRLFGLEYIIKKDIEGVLIYPILYPESKKIFSNFSELMNNYTIFNEPIIKNIDKIILLS